MAKSPFDLTSETLIKRVMSGKKEYRTNDYLLAFSNISSTELHHSDFSRFDIITLWNSLQKTPNKVKYFTFSITRDFNIMNDHVKKLCEHEKYAYICHDKDVSTHKHYHYVLMFESPRSFKSIANDLELPVTMLEKVYSKKGILDYLTHENDPNKHHYSIDEITSNFDIEKEKNKSDFDPWREFCDYVDMVEGRMSRRDWFDKYHYVLCDIGSFSQRHQMYHRIHEDFSKFGNGASLSSISNFPFRTPVKKSQNRWQTAFPEAFPEKSPWNDKDASKPFVIGNPDYVPPKPQKSTVGKYRRPNPRSDLADDIVP